MIRSLFIVVILAVAGGCATVKDYLSKDDNTTPPAELVEFTPLVEVNTLWSRDVGSGVEKQHLKLVPAAYDGQVFAASRGGLVSAFNGQDGSRIWEKDTEAPISGGPGVGDGLVLVGTSDAEVLALDQQSGELRWRVQVSSEVLAPPAAANGVVVVRTIDGKLAGLKSKDGKRLWVYDRIVPVLTLRGTSAPVVTDDMVLNGFDGGRLVALELRDGKLLWEARVTTPRGRSVLERMVDIDSDPLIMEGVVYVVTFQGRVAALDIHSGRILWQRDMSSHAGLGADEHGLYVTDDESQVWALDRLNSASLWRQTKLHDRSLTSPVPYGDYVVVGDFAGYLHWLRRDDGQFAARIKVDSAGLSASPLVVGDTVYAYGNSGKLVALQVQ
ncbi:MAG: outer membrane protein assembly factor BamB [Gammaproteobacteria bacterium]|nr:outer membrane protein assembly factor BamB [Gammaproteobacteria bacterium]